MTSEIKMTSEMKINFSNGPYRTNIMNLHIGDFFVYERNLYRISSYYLDKILAFEIKDIIFKEFNKTDIVFPVDIEINVKYK